MEPGPPAGDRTARRLRRLDARESAAISAGLHRPPPPPPPPRRITLGLGAGGSLSSPHSAGATAGYSTPAFRLVSSAFPPSTGTAVPFGLPDGNEDLEGGAALPIEERDLDASTPLSQVLGGASPPGRGSPSAVESPAHAAPSRSPAGVPTALYEPAVAAPGGAALPIEGRDLDASTPLSQVLGGASPPGRGGPSAAELRDHSRHRHVVLC